MSEDIRITVLVENSVHERGLKAEHGLAWHIQFGSRQVLFDTGQTDLLVENAPLLGISLEQLDAVVLSHGHDDHTGGLKTACARSPAAALHLHPAAVEAKFSANAQGIPRFIGMSTDAKAAVSTRATIVWSCGLTEVVPVLFATGEIPRQTDFEDVGGQFYLDERCQKPDPLVDDQALFFESQGGLVVVLGCAHAGVVNTLLHIEQLTGGKRIQAVLGGMHLLNASPARLAATVVALRQREISLLVPSHCTGWAAVARLWECFPGRCAATGVGRRFAFDR